MTTPTDEHPTTWTDARGRTRTRQPSLQWAGGARLILGVLLIGMPALFAVMLLVGLFGPVVLVAVLPVGLVWLAAGRCRRRDNDDNTRRSPLARLGGGAPRGGHDNNDNNNHSGGTS